MDKDIVIIGGGPGGYVCAIRAAQLGANVCVIEKDSLGGTCLNRGCIPTKALYRNAEIINTLKRGNEFGINISSFDINIEQIHKRKQAVVDTLVSGVDALLKANGVEVIKGIASIKDKNTVIVNLEDGNFKEITCSNIVIASGSKTFIPPIPGAELEGIYTSEDILNFENIPENLVIVGGGVIGMEFACIFSSLGSKVTVMEFLPNILAQVDTDLTKRLLPSLKKRGITVNTNTKVTKIEKNNEGFIVYGEGKKGETKAEAQKVLISIGRTPEFSKSNLEELRIGYDKKGIKVDENYETNLKGVYAIGDVNGTSMLAHAASHQGIVVAEKIMGIINNNHNNIVPGCIFIFPEISYVGITEDEAKTLGISYKVSKFMFGANGKALTIGEPEGMVKVIASSEDNTIIGVHIMGAHASDLIHEGALAVSNKMRVEDIKNTIHAHPTLSECFIEAVLGLNGEALHMIINSRK